MSAPAASAKGLGDIDRIGTWLAAIFLAVVVVAAFFAHWLPIQDPYNLRTLDFRDGLVPPWQETPSGFFAMLGTDDQGRDVFAALIYGVRTSLIVAFSSVLIAVVVGMTAGLVAAFAGGFADAVIMRIVDMQLSLPAILIALVLIAVFGQGFEKVILALVLVQWAYYARTVRGVALSENAKDYVAAAKSQGLPPLRIMFRHILPNCLPPLLVILTVQTAHAITLEATLSFLGLGLPKTQPSLGLLIANGFEFMLSSEYWISIYPGLALLLLVLTINLVGDRLRDVFNPRLAR